MRLDADRLATEGLELEIPGPHGTHTLVLGRSGGVTGTYAQKDGLIRLGAIRGDELQVARFEWQLASGPLRVEGPARLKKALIDAEIRLVRPEGAAAFVGTVAVDAADLRDASTRFGDGSVTGDVAITRLHFEGAADGAVEVSAESITVVTGRARFGAVEVDLGTIELGRPIVTQREGTLSVTVTRATLRDVVVRWGTLRVAIDRIELPRGVRFSGGAIEVSTVEVGELSVDLDPFALPWAQTTTGETAVEGPGADGTVTDRTVADSTVADHAAADHDVGPAGGGPVDQGLPAKKRGSAPFDLRILDTLNGKVDVDLSVDATVPVIGRRRATHHFRVPVVNGEIHYRALERDLRTLEDAFIDIKVRDGKLSIEKDIPLVPFYHRSLVLFRLPESEVDRARDEHLVRLRHFFEWELPEEKKERSSDRPARKTQAESHGGTDDKEKKSIGVRRLAFEAIDVDLHLDGHGRFILPQGGSLRLGEVGTPAIGGLTLDGDLRYIAEGEPAESELRLSASDVAVGLNDLPIGDRTLSIDALTLHRIEQARVVTQGLAPQRFRAVLRDLRLARIAVTETSTDHGTASTK